VGHAELVGYFAMVHARQGQADGATVGLVEPGDESLDVDLFFDVVRRPRSNCGQGVWFEQLRPGHPRFDSQLRAPLVSQRHVQEAIAPIDHSIELIAIRQG